MFLLRTFVSSSFLDGQDVVMVAVRLSCCSIMWAAFVLFLFSPPPRSAGVQTRGFVCARQACCHCAVCSFSPHFSGAFLYCLSNNSWIASRHHSQYFLSCLCLLSLHIFELCFGMQLNHLQTVWSSGFLFSHLLGPAVIDLISDHFIFST